MIYKKNMRRGDSVILRKTLSKGLITKVSRDGNYAIVQYCDINGVSMLEQFHISEILDKNESVEFIRRMNKIVTYYKKR